MSRHDERARGYDDGERTFERGGGFDYARSHRDEIEDRGERRSGAARESHMREDYPRRGYEEFERRPRESVERGRHDDERGEGRDDPYYSRREPSYREYDAEDRRRSDRDYEGFDDYARRDRDRRRR